MQPAWPRENALLAASSDIAPYNPSKPAHGPAWRNRCADNNAALGRIGGKRTVTLHNLDNRKSDSQPFSP